MKKKPEEIFKTNENLLLKIRRKNWERVLLPVKEYDFDVDVFSILVKEILEKMWHWLVGDVSADDDVPRKCWHFICLVSWRSIDNQNVLLLEYKTG